MEFGISFLPDCTPETKSGAQFYDDAIALSVEAEKLGYDFTKITEHYLHPYGGYCPDPLMFLSAVAAKTSRIRLMTGGIIAPFHHPLETASKIAMADAISNGRIEAGFVRGYLPYEYDAFGIDMNESKARYQATVTAVDALLHQRDVTLSTPFFQLRDATVFPPITQRRIPIWSASISRSSIEFAAANRYDLAIVLSFTHPANLARSLELYREQHPTGRVCVFAPLVLADTQSRAEETGHFRMRAYHRVWQDAAHSWQQRSSEDFDPMYASLAGAIEQIPVESLKHHLTTFFGTAEDVKLRMSEMIGYLQPDRILWNIDIGSMPLESCRETLQRFASDIMPSFQTSEPRRAANAT